MRQQCASFTNKTNLLIFIYTGRTFDGCHHVSQTSERTCTADNHFFMFTGVLRHVFLTDLIMTKLKKNHKISIFICTPQSPSSISYMFRNISPPALRLPSLSVALSLSCCKTDYVKNVIVIKKDRLTRYTFPEKKQQETHFHLKKMFVRQR